MQNEWTLTSAGDISTLQNRFKKSLMLRVSGTQMIDQMQHQLLSSKTADLVSPRGFVCLLPFSLIAPRCDCTCNLCRKQNESMRQRSVTNRLVPFWVLSNRKQLAGSACWFFSCSGSPRADVSVILDLREDVVTSPLVHWSKVSLASKCFCPKMLFSSAMLVSVFSTHINFYTHSTLNDLPPCSLNLKSL